LGIAAQVTRACRGSLLTFVGPGPEDPPLLKFFSLSPGFVPPSVFFIFTSLAPFLFGRILVTFPAQRWFRWLSCLFPLAELGPSSPCVSPGRRPSLACGKYGQTIRSCWRPVWSPSRAPLVPLRCSRPVAGYHKQTFRAQCFLDSRSLELRADPGTPLSGSLRRVTGAPRHL